MKKSVLTILVYFTFYVAFSPTINAEKDVTPPAISSESAIVLEKNTGEIIYEKNAERRMYPASLTKIATAIYAIENGDLDERVTVSKKASETAGSSVYIQEGDQIKLRQLVQGLLINSGNDAGVAIAEHLSDNVAQFTADLNIYLENKVGVKNTTFYNPHGLFNRLHMTTAKDLARITQYAMKNDQFNTIFGTKRLVWKSESWNTTLYTHHKLMRENPYKGITGGKTGYINQAGFTLATSATRGQTSLIVITLKTVNQNQAYEDTEKLLDYGFNNFQTSTLEKGSTFTLLKEEYRLPKTLSYTHLKVDKIEKTVESSGDLIISTAQGKVLSSVELEKVAPKLPILENLFSINTANVQGPSDFQAHNQKYPAITCPGSYRLIKKSTFLGQPFKC
ncbi:D-alanyl-D-alanine carboxypeptidase family protein [Sediminibacillus terrae]|uniref:D-alanyl-D-alanine carboxypeptidase family protein n=1 Tax=Sediminibacillus terrae TaxID=1562106 RepID=UPI00129512B7|nr:D-alanyl-D-alanine carboxypeptidase family protein [Sediminibacillus terrae]